MSRALRALNVLATCGTNAAVARNPAAYPTASWNGVIGQKASIGALLSLRWPSGDRDGQQCRHGVGPWPVKTPHTRSYATSASSALTRGSDRVSFCQLDQLRIRPSAGIEPPPSLGLAADAIGRRSILFA